MGRKLNPDEVSQGALLFTMWCADALERLGFTYMITHTHDAVGVDILISKNDRITAVHCHFSDYPALERDVAMVASVVEQGLIDEAAIISSCGFSLPAIDLAAKACVRLILSESLGPDSFKSPASKPTEAAQGLPSSRPPTVSFRQEA